ncbi:hypothetical protein ABZV93_09275 [Actinopolymorpha sp. NPDC004070]|uniref:hypothetical protein n=1 Tax=Actinopolymorpha sp. NPDC004070 TaxID=3154548 RepID=UPI0033B31ABE
MNSDGTVKYLYDVYLMRTGTAWQLRDSVCLGDPNDVVTTADVGNEVRKNWAVWVPPQQLSVQPANARTLVNLPTYFQSGQPQRMPAKTVHVFNFDVTVTAEGEWKWTFEPGVTKTFDTPGSSYDDSDPKVSYTYDKVGPRAVQLNTSWHGRFSVGAYGPYDIAQPAVQGPGQIDLDVVESGPVLGR